ncbi:hypothetical protein SCUCBS95973_002766 [Sporothrix curviconia]|uniref:Homeobox domain-containing protein n=1 Tax=Sporothrix curviconia TaxID=1260050 RepID=A0ABP0B9X2_9PEZI
MLATRHGDTELIQPWSLNKLETSSSLSLKASPPSPSPRMSNTGYETPLSNATTEWSGQYSFLPPTEPIFAAQAFDHVNGGSGGGSGGAVDSTASSSAMTGNNGVSSSSQAQTRPSSGTTGDASGNGSIKDDGSLNTGTSPLGLHQRCSIDPLGLRQHSGGASQTTVPSHMGGKTPPTATTATGEHHQLPHFVHLSEASHGGVHGSDVVSLTANPLSSVLQQHQPDILSAGSGTDDHSGLKDDDDLVDDEEMGEAGNPPLPAQTAAERTAQRRKMKRFRLTHQQTRFLMSEFAKQPHPDAAHRERLSREIPGLSPRQVQVWFQNRRAKIKRLAADDRERMIKMRAVPDDFDNVQALHSPYGAVHGLGTPMASPVDYSAAAAAAAASSYSSHMMRPLMVDVQRADGTSTSGGDDQSQQHSQHSQHSQHQHQHQHQQQHLQHSHHSHHMSPTGLSPGFGNIGFGSAATGSMGSSDILSPLSPSSSTDHRYGSYGATSTSSTSVMSPRNSNPYARQGNGSTSMDVTQSQRTQDSSASQRHHVRPLQPLQLRETVSRSRSDNLQSPLRSSMSWKGDSLDYSNYHHSSTGAGGGSTSPGRSSLYPSDGLGNGSSSAGLGGYDSYSGSPTHMAYPGFQSSPALQAATNSQSRSSRLRAASATLPLSLDLGASGVRGGGIGGGSPYRGVGSAAGTLSPTSGVARQPQMGSINGLISTSNYGTSYATSYASNSFPTSAPLTAPLDFGMSSSASRTGTGSGVGYRTGSTSSLSNGGIGVGGTDYGSMPQMGAPLAPPQDFSSAFMAGASTSGANSSSLSATSIAALSNNSSGGRSSSFGTGIGHHASSSISGGLGRSNTGGTTTSTATTATTMGSGTAATDFSASPTDADNSGFNGLKRKHSFTTGSNTSTGVYGSTA